MVRWSACVCLWGVVCVFGILPGCGGQGNQYVAPPPPKVTVMMAVKHPVVQFIEENGESEAVARADVRSRVRGFVEQINFEPGQSVNRDTVLYEIEDAPYVAARNAAAAEVTAAKAAIKVAEAQVLTAQTEVNRAQREFQRQTSLREQQAASQAELDVAQAAFESAGANLAGASASVESAEATLEQAEAKLETAELDLAYTKVHAPIEGRVTKTDIKVGNLVDNGTELTAVVNDSQVYVNFSIGDRQMLELRRSRMARNGRSASQEQWSQLPVFAKLETDEGFPHIGRLDYIDQEGVDVATGTLPLRAVFDNPDGKLLPGLFVRVRMPVSAPIDSLLLPARAVLRDRDTSFVMVIGENNLVRRRDVLVGQQASGWAVIRDGIEASDQVIVDGLQRSRPEMPVDPTLYAASLRDLPAVFQIDLSVLSNDPPDAASGQIPAESPPARSEESR